MTSSEDEITSLYKRLHRRDKCAHYSVIDLHVHSPASKCYVRVDKNNTDEKEYELLLETIINNDVEIIAITDHNTAKGYFEIKKILEERKSIRDRLGKKIILPGVEVTCYNKHFITLFPNDYTKDKIDTFLLECGIPLEEQGSEDASADRVSPLLLCEKVNSFGGILFIAHCDADKGLLQNYFTGSPNEHDVRGSSLRKILSSESLYGIFYNSPTSVKRLLELKSTFGIEHLAILQASDSHSSINSVDNYKGPGLPLGSRKSWIKLGELSFRALCLALKNSKSIILNSQPEEKANPTILGLCVRGGFIKDIDNAQKWSIIPFAEELNCIVGARGTGKSTLLDILKFLLDRENYDLRDNVLKREDSFETAVVFLKSEREVYAIRMQPESLSKLNITYYHLDNGMANKIRDSRKFQNSLKSLTKNLEITNYLTSTNIQSYSQKEIFYLAIEEFGPTWVVDNLCALKFKNEFRNTLKNVLKHKRNVTLSCINLYKERMKDENADLSSSYLEESFHQLQMANARIQQFQIETIESLNFILDGKLKLNYKLTLPIDEREITNIVESLVYKERVKNNIIYEIQVSYKKLFKNLFRNISEDWALPFHLFTGNYTAMIKNYNMNSELAKMLCKTFYDKVEPEDVVITPKLLVNFELNISYGLANRSSLYRVRNNLSFGQRAVGMLLLILHGATKLGEDRPLIIDQPEDDLDNLYIYHTLVKEFHAIKNSRQLIIATHNPNIPIAGDAENILVLNSNGDNGWIENWGSIDNEKISKKVLQVLEGDFEAFSKRAEKYGFVLKKHNIFN